MNIIHTGSPVRTMFSLSKYIKSYFAETSLHGLKYITEEGRVTLERLLWVILVCSGIVLAVIFMLPGVTIVQSDTKDTHSILQVSINTSTTPPAPAWTRETTLCTNYYYLNYLLKTNLPYIKVGKLISLAWRSVPTTRSLRAGSGQPWSLRNFPGTT